MVQISDVSFIAPPNGAHLNVGLSVDVSDDLLEAPEAAGQQAEQSLRHLARLPLQLLLHVGQYGSQQLDDGDDQGAKRKRTSVETGG